MKTLVLMTVLVVQAAEPAAPEVGSVPALEEVLTSKELGDYRRKRDYEDRMEIFRKALDQRARVLRSQIRERQIQPALELLENIQALSRHALQDSLQEKDPKRLRDKEVKRLEIRIRRLVESLNDLSLSVPFEYREEFEQTRTILKELRNRLLKQLFGDALGRRVPAGKLPGAEARGLGFAPASAAPPAQTLLTGDRFTDEEFTKIQEAQELVKRVEVLLEICEARFQEIQRRQEGKEWDTKDPNPLEFHTYNDMIYAYERALESIMINIDEKHKYRTASSKDVRKSLEKLNEKVQEFIPRLQALQEWAKEQRDEGLYRQIQKALKASEIALKGSQYGLGAPVN